MNNPIARFASNVTETPVGGIFLDAFCGSGGILIEAGLDGCFTLGIDIDYYYIRGVRLNMRYYAPERRLGEIRASALALPLRCDLGFLCNLIQGAGSDLPYGRSTSCRGRTLPEIWEAYLQEIIPILKPSAKCCLITPDTPEVQEWLPHLAEFSQFRLVKTLRQYVH